MLDADVVVVSLTAGLIPLALSTPLDFSDSTSMFATSRSVDEDFMSPFVLLLLLLADLTAVDSVGVLVFGGAAEFVGVGPLDDARPLDCLSLLTLIPLLLFSSDCDNRCESRRISGSVIFFSIFLIK